MDKKEFSQIRQYLRKTQEDLARLLCVSTRAIQSFEQGWRNIPVSVERQLLFHLSLKRSSENNIGPCWDIQSCPAEWREKCSAWEYRGGHYCWFINGTYCQGKLQKNWMDKKELCRQCEVFKLMLPPI